MKKLKIGIQGVEGSFHERAAHKYFGKDIETIECDSFKLLCDVLQNHKADLCVMAIENTLAGSILPNYSLLESYQFKVIGEIYLQIEQCLMALPGQQIEDIEVAQSHPIALLQCEEFLSEHPHLRSVETRDTADSAKEIRDKNLYKVAAIASRSAAEIYGLEILAANIQTHKLNFTRFLIISRDENHVTINKPDKASLSLQLADKAGALVKVLEVFAQYEINLTKIQSIPILGLPYIYSFHFDMEWEQGTNYAEALAQLTPLVEKIQVFGIYKKGMKFEKY